MTINVRVTRNIVVNGVEYESVEQMPQEIRATFERALAGGQRMTGPITINGVVYPDLDAVPEELRSVLKPAIASSTGIAAAAPRQATPGRMAAWMLLAAAVIGLLLLIYSSPR